MAVWMLYTLAASLLLSLAALGGERLLQAREMSTRWVWLATLAGSLTAPLLLPRPPVEDTAPGAAPRLVVSTSPVVEVADAPLPFDTTEQAPEGAALLDRVLYLGWLGGSAAMATLLLLSVATLERERRSWRPRRLHGQPVQLSAATGPAVAGLLWPEIVVPRSVLKWDEGSLRLLLAHERAHQRAGDTHLLLGAVLLLVLAPWNVVLWWQVRRLRGAIELDCDARVLRSGGDPDEYGRLLLRAARTGRPTLLPAAAFVPSVSLLERRIRRIAGSARRPSRALLAASWTAALVAPLAVYALPAPALPGIPGRSVSTGLTPEAVPPGGTVTGQETLAAHLLQGPAYTNFDQRPELRNASAFAAAVKAAYAATAQHPTAEDTAHLWVLVDGSGQVRRTHLARSSGDLALDHAAREALVRTARFAPARSAGRPAAAWIQVPVAGAAAAGSPSDGGMVRLQLATTPLPPPPSHAASPASTPVRAGAPLSAPQLRDPGVFARQVASSRPLGSRGTSHLWVLVDASGTPRSTRLAESAGDGRLDLIARELVLAARFSPARDADGAVQAWARLAVDFGGN